MKTPYKIIIVVVLTAAFIVGILDLMHLPGLLTVGIGLILVCVAANEWNGYKITKEKKYLITPMLFMGALLVAIVVKALNL